MILENMENPTLKRASINGCAQLSVNVEHTNRAGFCGLRRKITAHNAKDLRRDWKTQIGPKRGRNLIPALTDTIIGGSHGY